MQSDSTASNRSSTAAGLLSANGDVPRHHVRVPDERARLRAHAGHARVARLRAGPGARRGRPDPLQHLLDPRVGRQQVHRPSRRGEAAEVARTPSRVVGVGGCWAQSVKDEVFERFPFVDVAFGPGQIHRLAEFLQSDSLTAQGYFEFEDFAGHLPSKREREFQGWLQISQGCNCRCSYCIVPQTRGREQSRDPERARRRARAPRRRRRSRDHAARPERQQLRARSARASAGSPSPSSSRSIDARRGHRAHPLHEPASQGHARGRHPRPRRASGAAASTSTCRSSRAPAASSRRCGAPTTAAATSIASRRSASTFPTAR